MAGRGAESAYDAIRRTRSTAHAAARRNRRRGPTLTTVSSDDSLNTDDAQRSPLNGTTKRYSSAWSLPNQKCTGNNRQSGVSILVFDLRSKWRVVRHCAMYLLVMVDHFPCRWVVVIIPSRLEPDRSAKTTGRVDSVGNGIGQSPCVESCFCCVWSYARFRFYSGKG
jgi:hypothetical protein